MIVLDASVVIAFLSRRDELHRRAVAAFQRLGPERYALSPITHAEVLAGPVRAGTLARTRAAITALGVTEIALPPDAAARLAQLRAATGLRLPDCCVILAAESSPGCELLTFDADLAAAAERRGLRVCAD